MSQNDDAVLRNWLTAQGFDEEIHESLLTSIQQSLTPNELQQAVQAIGASQSLAAQSEAGTDSSEGQSPPQGHQSLNGKRRRDQGDNLIFNQGTETMMGHAPVSALMELFEPPKKKVVAAQDAAPLSSLMITYTTAGGSPEELGVLRGPNWKEGQKAEKSKGPSQ